MSGDLAALRALAEKATPGPWEQGDIWLRAGVMDERYGEGKCAFCARNGEPEWVGSDDINGRRMLAHLHRNSDPYDVEHAISGPKGASVAGMYDTDAGGIDDPADTAFIAAVDPQTVLALVEAVEAARGGSALGHFTQASGVSRCPECLHPQGAPWHQDDCRLGAALAAFTAEEP